MKLTLPVTLLAVAASASVVDHDNTYCHAEGQACDTVKRAADAFADAIAQNDEIATRDETNGETAWIVNRQLHELALSTAATRGEPDYWYRSLTPSRSAADADKANEKRADEPWCTRFLGQPCWGKRDAEPLSAPLPPVNDAIEHGNALKMARDADPKYCTRSFGGSCWKRDAWCNSPAGLCTKATCDLHAMWNAARAVIDAWPSFFSTEGASSSSACSVKPALSNMALRQW
ncbi:hypothetical protein N657DRAFT_652532 [Parathielavia appendiculata]|uniref:Clock-controlled pheromone ccg-4 n=1 Tax=Parathielavia appendiculata TaxID=2587402 RepID=A0AAN6U9P0_9PEZI|nr:hypothetical protein N657DRAFT_652532 [Parathielavia appendiculata]